MRSTRQSALVHGVIGGLRAGVIVAIWFLAVDLFAGDPLRTPARLGAALFGQPDTSSGVLVANLGHNPARWWRRSPTVGVVRFRTS